MSEQQETVLEQALTLPAKERVPLAWISTQDNSPKEGAEILP